MKKSLIMILAALVIVFIGCVKELEKEGICETTKLIGRVIEESTQNPVAGVKVSITNGSRTYASCTTKEDGNFELLVNFDRIDKDYYLLMDGGTAAKTKKAELHGMGMEMYDYTNIILYNSLETDGLPVISLEMTSISAHSAVCKAEIIAGTDVNVAKRGFCWSSSNENPTISNHVLDNGSGAGNYTGKISGLAQNTNYYVRAYAQTTDTIAYSDPKSFKTALSFPTFQFGGETYYVAPDPEVRMTWSDAEDYCNKLTIEGLSGWRLPTLYELKKMYVESSSIGGFYYGITGSYWSSNPCNEGHEVFDFHFDSRDCLNGFNRVRPIRKVN